jgi:isocitrate lyase
MRLCLLSFFQSALACLCGKFDLLYFATLNSIFLHADRLTVAFLEAKVIVYTIQHKEKLPRLTKIREEVHVGGLDQRS